MASKYLNTREAAAYLGISRQWLEVGRSKGYGPPFIKAGNGQKGFVRYRRADLDQWMRAHQSSHAKNEVVS